MANSFFEKVKISGIVTCVPEHFRLLDEEIDNLYNGDIKQVNRIKKTIGLNKRHIVEDENTTTSDLCEIAANNLLDNMEIDKLSIDAIIFVSQTPDYFQPATATYLHGKLGLSQNCVAFDVNQGCTGYIYGLWLSHMMIETNSCRKILLLAGDTLSRVVNPKDSNVAPIFGDAGTATLLEKSDKLEKTYFSLHTDGSRFDTIIQPKGAFRVPTEDIFNEKEIFEISDKRNLNNLYMNGAEVFNFSIYTEPEAIKEILKLSNATPEEIDYIIFHQANKYIISNIARRLNFSLEKAPSETTGKYGNQSSASIPCTICDAIRKEAISRSLRLIFSGFGVGLSWASCQLKLDRIYCPEVIFHKKGELKL